jgi:hypothetical protein
VAKSCIFCGSTPTSREHIFSRSWLARVMPSGAKFTHTQSHGLGDERFETWWEKHEADMVVRCVCERCNNEWMDTLDRQADRLVTPMVQRRRVSLVGFTDQALLAAWICKAAMLGDQAKPSPGVRPEDHRYFYEHWQPPQGWWIWVAGVRELPGQYEAWINTRNLKGRDSEGRIDDGYLATIVVNYFVAQAVVLHFRKITVPDREANKSLFRQVWPPTYETTEWPPLAAVKRADLEVLQEAFTDVSWSVE